jgi:uncharacterized protein (DUF433 family)
MPDTTTYTYLAPRLGSRYKQYFFTGRNLRAETLYRATVGLEPMTANEVAKDYDVPVEAVLEAIQYCLQNTALLQTEREEDWSESGSLGLDDAPPLTSNARVGPFGRAMSLRGRQTHRARDNNEEHVSDEELRKWYSDGDQDRSDRREDDDCDGQGDHTPELG